MVSQGAHVPLPEGVFAPYELVRELGARPSPAYAVRQVQAPGTKAHLLVGERFYGAARGPDGKDSDFVREARRIATLTSPNLPRVRDVVARGDDAIVFSEYIDGEKLAALWRPDGLPLEIALRVIVDVLSGVATLHNLRDARQQPLKLAHGELSTATIVFGLDGVARVLHAIARRAPGALPDAASLRTMAPEVLTGESHDQRADVYGAGALLWEALAGEPLLRETDPIAMAARVRAGALPRATVPASAPWAKDLVEVAAKALSASPDDRWPNATVMAGELRKAAGLRLAPVSTTAAFAKSAIAERAKARRQALETQPAKQAAPRPGQPAIAVVTPAPVIATTTAPAVVIPVTSPPLTAPSRPAPDAATPRPPVAASPSAPVAPVAVVAATPEPEAEGAGEGDVLVAPGLRAPLADVVELGSDSLLEASESIPPPAAPGGFALDPFALTAPPGPGALPAHPAPVAIPPPAPPVAGPASPAPPAFDLPLAAAEARSAYAADPVPEPRPPSETEPSLERVSRRQEATRRRKVLVLGGVASLGGLILVLALVRWATRDTTTHESPHAPVAGQVAPPAASPVAAAVAPPSAPPTPPPTVANPIAPPTPSTPSAAATPTPVAATPPPARPKLPPPPRPPPATAPRPKRSKPAFDPNTL